MKNNLDQWTINRCHHSEPLIQGGTEVDDTLMELVCLSEIAGNSTHTQKVIEGIKELIHYEYVEAKKRAGEM